MFAALISLSCLIVLYMFLAPQADEISSAKRWINLSEEILRDADIAMQTTNRIVLGPNVSRDVREKLWQQEAEEETRDTEEKLRMMDEKYLFRLEEARNEIKKYGIPPQLGVMPLSEQMVNFYSWKTWAIILNASGQKVLKKYGING